MEGLLQLVILGILVEAVVDTFKLLWEDGGFVLGRGAALVVGLILAFTLNIDLLAKVGLNPRFDIVGIILTGIIISRGGNYVHDFLGRVKGE